MPRPKGSPNKITAEIKERLSQVIMDAMSSINIDLMTQNEKLKLIQIGLTYVIPRLKQVEEITEETTEEEVPSIEESKELTEILYSELKTTEKIDSALPLVQDLNQHDKEMDDIHQKALDAFNDLVQLGMNVEVHAGAKLLETANQMLKTAMEAKDSKVDRKLKMINLQLQKAKLDHSVKKSLPEGTELESDGAITIDRNELLKRIDNAAKEIKNDK